MTPQTAHAPRKASPRYGSPTPRIAPPIPARSQLKEYKVVAAEMGIELFPWQETAIRYATALDANDLWLYPEYAEVVSRQNGKTIKLKPLIVMRLRMGRRIMHTAQNRELPREVFGEVADFMYANYRSELRRRPRFANGQEEIKMKNGGSYRIVAPTRGGARGPSNDDVFIDEVRELVDTEFIGAAEPTLTASKNPQMGYLSNAGTESSVVLNDLKIRAEAGDDASLAFLEWSAEASRATGDIEGWYESNPSLGHMPQMLTYLERKHRAYEQTNKLHIFNTEHLCRWVTSDLPAFVEAERWLAARRPSLGKPQRPALAVSLDPSGKRASMAVAWQDADGINLRIIGDVTGDPIDTDKLGADLRQHALKLGVTLAGHDPETDAHLAKYLRKPEAITGGKFTAACSRFVALAESGRLRWEGPDELIEDMRWTSRHTDPQDGTYRAVRAKEDRPVTPIMAAIRAVWLASGPRPTAMPKAM